MKNLFELSQKEKNRIINLHENATKRLYLVEQEVVQGGKNDPYQYRKTGDKVEYATKGVENWKQQTNPKGIEAINKLFTKSSPTTTPPPQPTPQLGVPTPQPTPSSPITTGATPTPTPTPTPRSQVDVKTTEALTEKIKQNCGQIWTSFEERLKASESQMAGKDLNTQKDITRKMSRDENKVFRYCHNLYKPKVTEDEKTKFVSLNSNFKKFLSASYKFLSPIVVKMMTDTVEKAADAGGEAVLKSLKIGEEYNNHKLNKLIKESIRKNTRNL
jgi:hypothetical protein